jgi:hypothetical protein
VSVDVEFEAAETVEFEALALAAFPAFPFFPAALVVAASAVAVSFARRCELRNIAFYEMRLPAALTFFGDRSKSSETTLCQ